MHDKTLNPEEKEKIVKDWFNRRSENEKKEIENLVKEDLHKKVLPALITANTNILNRCSYKQIKNYKFNFDGMTFDFTLLGFLENKLWKDFAKKIKGLVPDDL
jgi:hypothetical protein